MSELKPSHLDDAIRMLREIGSGEQAKAAIRAAVGVLVACGYSNSQIKQVCDDEISRHIEPQNLRAK
jgi:hypothetical protein